LRYKKQVLEFVADVCALFHLSMYTTTSSSVERSRKTSVPSAVLALGHAGQLPGGPTSIGAPC